MEYVEVFAARMAGYEWAVMMNLDTWDCQHAWWGLPNSSWTICWSQKSASMPLVLTPDGYCLLSGVEDAPQAVFSVWLHFSVCALPLNLPFVFDDDLNSARWTCQVEAEREAKVREKEKEREQMKELEEQAQAQQVKFMMILGLSWLRTSQVLHAALGQSAATEQARYMVHTEHAG